PTILPIRAVAHDARVPLELVPALVLGYGAHLAGVHGVAPVDVARVLGGRWDEALARGELGSRGLLILERSRLCLSPALEQQLDELP
ncbi:MAG: hypothetical protein M3680_23135, partial [Myxococcota bacterium]|nr:hypothetical protein [Myxococcota bacterium]